MSFRISGSGTSQRAVTSTGSERKIYNQTDIDLIEEKYKEKEDKLKRFIEQPANPVLDQYRKALLSNPTFEKETIVYDPTISKWKVVKTEK